MIYFSEGLPVQPNKGIYWLASYPKSGNTWFRIFLANLLNTTDNPINLNAINTGAIASGRSWVDEALGFDSADLTHKELDALRPAVYKWYSETEDTIGYHKIHDAYTYLDNGLPLIPKEGSLGALYLIRNPLDVSISFAAHSHCTIDEAIQSMGNKKFGFCRGKNGQHNQLRQHLLSWSDHVKSWTNTQLNTLVIRYEDMKLNSIDTFTNATQFLKLEASESKILEALENSAIKKLQKQEKESGFREKPPKMKKFFRKGKVGDWQRTLSPAQIQQIIHDHGDIMQTYGYIDQHKNPIIF